MITNCKTGFLFPPFVIPSLTKLRGDSWSSFVQEISKKPDNSIETIAFTYMMVKMNNCHTCNSDSFRAMNGCIKCSSQSITRFRGSDSDLLDLYKISVNEVEAYHRKSE